ncbi:PREDICTED: NADH dehydrogenase [ubiquinone] 1 alpha subcomplex assembly factor 3 [Nanorana parkeri]|uniref:NADH dehydrogenase [ubiquinone] 1 alpha subcomplex assembly factor 3 n=1 Tax=Nanorana parkeri TaxID=125878 RepID=UPI000854DF57|nr:PREDICTED: NADH dehydrogenase [ubiquinone] 1 alpha subcomplex assembly factor 3 [Nanorana parkeri]
MIPSTFLGLRLLRASAPRWIKHGSAITAPTWQQQRSHRLSPTGDELYERTTVTHIERDSPDMMFVESYSRQGFIINGNQTIGPCAIIPRAILEWRVRSYKDISYESLSLFRLLVPRIEILVLGTGDRVERLDPNLLKLMRQNGVAVEVQDTPNACATFNFLTSERRLTAAALIPVIGDYKVISPTDHSQER